MMEQRLKSEWIQTGSILQQLVNANLPKDTPPHELQRFHPYLLPEVEEGESIKEPVSILRPLCKE